MKLDKFIDKLFSVGFIQNDGGEMDCYENYINRKGVFINIMGDKVDYNGHIPITINILDDNTDEETEKDYITTEGAWNAIKRLF